MGGTFKIRNRKKMDLCKRKVCSNCKENKVPRYHHSLCNKCWDKLYKKND